MIRACDLGPALSATRVAGSHEGAEIEPAALLCHGLPEIAELRDPRGDIPDGEVRDAQALLDFLPGHRRRDAGFGTRARRVDRGERAAPPVLVVVDEDAAARTVRDLVLGGHQRRMA